MATSPGTGRRTRQQQKPTLRTGFPLDRFILDTGYAAMSDAKSADIPPPEPGRLAPRQGATGPTGWQKWLPGLQTLRHYEAAWLRHDVAAGLVLTTMLVPVGIAYAVASGVPGIYGLYATIIPLLAYSLFGPSRILVLGPDSSLAALILAVVLPLSAGDPLRAVALASMMAVVSGVLCILAGVARLGFVTELLSKAIRYGYMNGIALTVLISQLPQTLGFSVNADDPLRKLWAFFHALLAGKTNPTRATGRRRHPGAHPVAQAQQAHAGGADRRDRRHRPGRHTWPRRTGRVGSRLATAGPAGLRHPLDHAG